MKIQKIKKRIEDEKNMKDDAVSAVSVVKCSRYDPNEVETSLRMAINAIGGIGKFISKGETILLKPNMLSARDPKFAVTTHPEIVRAAIRLVREAGAIPIVGDSPSGRSNEKILRRLAEKTGIWKICEEEKVEFVFFIEPQSLSFPQGKVIKSFDITTYLSKVDGIISLGKLKTHTFMGLTGGVKNLFGLIPGSRKSDYHAQFPDLEQFSEFLVDLAEFVRPRLVIIDGIVGMEGEGPLIGTVRNFEKIVVSDNPHMTDAVLVNLVGTQADRVCTVDVAIKRGLIPKNIGEINIVGDTNCDAAEVKKIDKFSMPNEPTILDKILISLGVQLDRKPVFFGSKCSLCGSCIDACPGDALKKGKKKPIVEYKLCIRCYCCQEVCGSKAIALKPLYLRSFGRSLVNHTFSIIKIYKRFETK